jgi:hypothetical protein
MTIFTASPHPRHLTSDKNQILADMKASAKKKLFKKIIVTEAKFSSFRHSETVIAQD